MREIIISSCWRRFSISAAAWPLSERYHFLIVSPSVPRPYARRPRQRCVIKPEQSTNCTHRRHSAVRYDALPPHHSSASRAVLPPPRQTILARKLVAIPTYQWRGSPEDRSVRRSSL